MTDRGRAPRLGILARDLALATVRPPRKLGSTSLLCVRLIWQAEVCFPPSLKKFASAYNFAAFANVPRGKSVLFHADRGRGKVLRNPGPGRGRDRRNRRAGRGRGGRWGGSPRRRAARRVVANLWQIFGKISLVFGCIGADLCNQIRVLQHFSKSTRLSN